MDFKVLINDEAADIGNPTDFNIVIHRELLDFANPTSQGGDHTYDVLFPPTKRNAAIFGPATADYRTSQKFRSVQSLRIAIYSNGQRIFDGVPVVKSASADKGYRVTMFGNDIDWVSLLDSRSLRALALPASPFTGSRIYGAPVEPVGAMTARTITGLDHTETIVQFPLVAYGNYYLPGGLQSGLTATRVQDINWQQVPPSVYIVRLLQAIFNQAGYQIAGGFFDREEFCRLLMPYTGDAAPKWNWGLLARANASAGLENYHEEVFNLVSYDFQIGNAVFWHLRTATVNWDYSASYFQAAPVEQYITPISGTYRFTINTGNVNLVKEIGGPFVGVPAYDFLRQAIAIVIVPDDADEYLALQTSISDYISDGSIAVVSDPNIIAFYDFGTGYQESPYTLLPFTVGGTYGQIQTGLPGAVGAQILGNGTVEITIEGVQLPVATRVEFWLTSQWGQSNPIALQDIGLSAYTVDIKETSYSDELEISPLLPDISQMTFVKWIVTAFDLLFTVDQMRRIIRFETREDFYQSNRFAQDWTAFASIIGKGIRPVPFYEQTTFTWANDDNDALIARFGLAQFNHTESSDSVHAIADTETIEVGFAPTYEREYSFKGLAGAPLISTLIIPCITSASQLALTQDEIEWEYNYRPRLLKYLGLVPGYWKQDGVVYADYPAARFSFDETGGFALPLGQNAGRVVRANGIVNSPVQNDGLYLLFWRNFIRLRELSHIQEIEVLLDAYQFNAADISVPIVVDGLHYWLYSFVDPFDPITPSRMKVELIRQV